MLPTVTLPVTLTNRRNQQLARTLYLMALLQEHRWTVVDLAERLRVTRRTIYRDLEALQQVEWPVERVVGEDGIPRYHRRHAA